MFKNSGAENRKPNLTPATAFRFSCESKFAQGGSFIVIFKLSTLAFTNRAKLDSARSGSDSKSKS